MRTIFAAVFIGALFLLIVLWLIGGGWARIMANIHGTLNPFSLFYPSANDEGALFHLPWQPDFNSFGVDLVDLIELPSNKIKSVSVSIPKFWRFTSFD